ncbi:BUD13 homolog isoform X2 [Sceloporus undulatus]|nr:BUD13 homolog isoform X2 [Sceloporus undulatus]
MRIVDDDDTSWKSVPVEQEKEDDEGDEGDLPVVAEFIDERPDEVKWMEVFRTSNKWKLLGEQNEVTQRTDRPAFVKSTNSSEAAKQKNPLHFPDQSPPERGRHNSPDQSPTRRGRHDSPDQSPPRRGHHDLLDQFAPRRGRHDSKDGSPTRRGHHESPDQSPPRRVRYDSPDQSPPRRGHHHTKNGSPPRWGRHDPPDQSPPRRAPHDSSDQSPPRRSCHNLPNLSVKRLHSGASINNSRPLSEGQQERFPKKDSAHLKRPATPEASAPRKKTHSSDANQLFPRKQPSSQGSPGHKKSHPRAPSPRKRQRHDSDSGSDSHSLPRGNARASSDSDLSPPRPSRNMLQWQNSPSDLSPPRRKHRGSSDSDLSPPRRGQAASKKTHRSKSPPDRSSPHWTEDSKERSSSQRGPQMLSGGKAGLVSAELLRREQQDLKRQGGSSSKHLEAQSQNAETVFRDKSGRKRDLKQERLEQQKKAEEKSEREEQYAKWGKGLAQSRQQQQNIEDAVKEMQKPLARYIDDQDLDKMLREQEREGDPMADFLRKKKAKEKKDTKEKPRYNGPAPPLNRFNIWPGYRWDGVDRSNGFEQKRFARIASKKAVQELAYKWSVEDM